MELHPVEAVKQLPRKLIDGLHELREVLIGPAPEEPSNEDLSRLEAENIYRSQHPTARSGRRFPTGGLSQPPKQN